MRSYVTCLVSAAVLAASGNAGAQRSSISLYTDIAGKACSKHIDDESTGAATMDCPGVQGFRLLVLDDDERSSISVVTPDKRVFPLDYWDVVTRGFSTLGAKAEWRMAKVGGKVMPVAVIVRVHSLDQSDPEHPKRVPFLAVAKISRDGACVTRAVEVLGPEANEQARRFADDQHLECLRTESKSTPPTKG